MKILCLYNNKCALPLFDRLSRQGNDVVLCSEKITPDWCLEQEVDLTVSYTYRYILDENTILALNENIVNLHNSYLPWNRGADPNLWSVLVGGGVRGVTVHYITTDLDEGDIITQCVVPLSEEDTLKTSYDALDETAQNQFMEVFPYYEYWPQMRKKALGKGSYHSIKDGLILHSVIDTYDLPIGVFRERVNQIMTK